MLTIANCDGDDRDLAAYGRLLRELSLYCATPAREPGYEGFAHSTDRLRGVTFDVYIWRAAVKQFRRIGTAKTYRAADLMMRQHIYKRYRRRQRRLGFTHQTAPLYARCSYCDYLRRRSVFADDICGDCYTNIGVEPYTPDDYPAFDADFLFGV